MQRCRVKAAMLQTLPALFIWSPLLGPYVNLPGECMCCLVYNQLISTEYVLHLPGDKALRRGWETREGRKIPRRTAGRELGLVHDRVVEVGERERKKIHFNSFSLKDEGRKKKNIPLCLPSLAFRRTVLATIFSISIVRMWVPSSRDTFHSAEKDGFSDQTCRRRSGCCTRTGRTRHWRIVGV